MTNTTLIPMRMARTRAITINRTMTSSVTRMEDPTLSIVPHPVRKTLALTTVLVIAAPTAQAAGFGDMFNPGRWFGGHNNDAYYDDGPWGPYGLGPYGAPGYGPYGGPGYGPYGAPGYGAPGYGAPGYGAQAPAYGAPAYGAAPLQGAPAQPTQGSTGSGSDNNAKDQEIEALKQRIEQLESRNAAPSPLPPPSRSDGDQERWPAAPTFRPMEQY